MELIDTHAHLDLPEFAADLVDVLHRAAEAGVGRIVCVGTSADASRECIALARRFPDRIAATVGIQPNYAAEAGPEDFDRIAEMAAHPEVVAVGETGLDNHWDFTPPEVQEDYFRRHVRLSLAVDKPLVVHVRNGSSRKSLAGENVGFGRRPRREDAALSCDRASPSNAGMRPKHRSQPERLPRGTVRADERALAILHEEAMQLHGARHCFEGTPQTAAAWLELGFHLSFGGTLTREGHRKLKAAAAMTPPERLLIETDCPYLSPVGAPPGRNEPANVKFVVEALARIRHTTPEDIAALTTRNAERLFFGHFTTP